MASSSAAACQDPKFESLTPALRNHVDTHLLRNTRLHDVRISDI